MSATMDPGVEVLEECGVRPALDREAVALMAARDARADGSAPVGQTTGGLESVDAEGRRMATELGQRLEGELGPVEEDLDAIEGEIRSQRKVVKALEEETTKTRDKRAQAEVFVAAIARVKGRAFIELRKVPTRLYLVSLGVLGAGDTILNATALQVIGEGNLVLWGLAIALAVGLLWMAHVAGNEMREAEEHPNDPAERRQRWWALLGVVSAMLVFLLTIGWIRAEFLEVEGWNGHLLPIYGLQLVVVAAAVALAYYHANSYAEALERADAEVRKAQEAQEAQEDLLDQLEGQEQVLQTRKVYLVARHLRAGEYALTYAEGLKQVYMEVYYQARKPDAPPVELLVPPPHVPGWMWEWARWINQQTVVDRPPMGTDWQRALPEPSN